MRCQCKLVLHWRGPLRLQYFSVIFNLWLRGPIWKYQEFSLDVRVKLFCINSAFPLNWLLCFAAISRYIVQFVFTLLALLLWPTSNTSFWHQCWNLGGHFKQLIASIVSKNETKEKDEDANYEYEMMWDAEGSMHLIKKPLKSSTVNSNERSLGER